MHSVNLTITGPIDDWENILFQYNFTGYKGGVLNYAQGATYIGGSLPQTDQAFIETFPNVSVDMARTYATWTVYDRAFTHKNYTLISFPSISTIDVAVTNILPSKGFGYNCGLSCNNYTFYPIGVVVTVANQGNLTESFNVTLTANSVLEGVAVSGSTICPAELLPRELGVCSEVETLSLRSMTCGSMRLDGSLKCTSQAVCPGGELIA